MSSYRVYRSRIRKFLFSSTTLRNDVPRHFPCARSSELSICTLPPPENILSAQNVDHKVRYSRGKRLIFSAAVAGVCFCWLSPPPGANSFPSLVSSSLSSSKEIRKKEKTAEGKSALQWFDENISLLIPMSGCQSEYQRQYQSGGHVASPLQPFFHISTERNSSTAEDVKGEIDENTASIDSIDSDHDTLPEFTERSDRSDRMANASQDASNPTGRVSGTLWSTMDTPINVDLDNVTKVKNKSDAAGVAILNASDNGDIGSAASSGSDVLPDVPDVPDRSDRTDRMLSLSVSVGAADAATTTAATAATAASTNALMKKEKEKEKDESGTMKKEKEKDESGTMKKEKEKDESGTIHTPDPTLPEPKLIIMSEGSLNDPKLQRVILNLLSHGKSESNSNSEEDLPPLTEEQKKLLDNIQANSVLGDCYHVAVKCCKENVSPDMDTFMGYVVFPIYARCALRAVNDLISALQTKIDMESQDCNEDSINTISDTEEKLQRAFRHMDQSLQSKGRTMENMRVLVLNSAGVHYFHSFAAEPTSSKTGINNHEFHAYSYQKVFLPWNEPRKK